MNSCHKRNWSSFAWRCLSGFAPPIPKIADLTPPLQRTRRCNRLTQFLSSPFWSKQFCGTRDHPIPFPASLIRVRARSRVWVAASGIFLLAIAVRLVNLDQPLLENFIDRQVHTAMMARNLTRNGSIFYPAIDIAPFPAYYMLEFPGYPALVITAATISGLELDVMGRLVSATAMATACLLIYDLMRRRDGQWAGILAGAALAVMPVTLRYGRA